MGSLALSSVFTSQALEAIIKLHQVAAVTSAAAEHGFDLMSSRVCLQCVLSPRVIAQRLNIPAAAFVLHAEAFRVSSARDVKIH